MPDIASWFSRDCARLRQNRYFRPRRRCGDGVIWSLQSSNQDRFGSRAPLRRTSAGCLAGLLAFVLEVAKVTPLILAAEVYERQAPPAQVGNAAHAEHAAPEWEPADGLE